MTDDLSVEIDVSRVAELQQNKADFILLDCREQDEFDLVHIEGARLLPMSELMVRAAELDDERDRHIVVYCHAGMRSEQVARWLRQQGFAKTQSMTGGIDAWSCEIDPTLPRY